MPFALFTFAFYPPFANRMFYVFFFHCGRFVNCVNCLTRAQKAVYLLSSRDPLFPRAERSTPAAIGSTVLCTEYGLRSTDMYTCNGFAIPPSLLACMTRDKSPMLCTALHCRRDSYSSFPRVTVCVAIVPPLDRSTQFVIPLHILNSATHWALECKAISMRSSVRHGPAGS